MHQDGKTYKEIAEKLGIPISTVGDSVRRIRSGRPRRATPEEVSRHLQRVRVLNNRLAEAREAVKAAQRELDEEIYAARADQVGWPSIASVLALTPSHLSEKYIVNRRDEAVQRGAV